MIVSPLFVTQAASRCLQPGCTGLSPYLLSGYFRFEKNFRFRFAICRPHDCTQQCPRLAVPGDQTDGLLVAHGLSLLGVLSSAQGRGHQETSMEARDPQELGQWLTCSSQLPVLWFQPCRHRPELFFPPRQARPAFPSTPLETSLGGGQQCSILSSRVNNLSLVTQDSTQECKCQDESLLPLPHPGCRSVYRPDANSGFQVPPPMSSHSLGWLNRAFI